MRGETSMPWIAILRDALAIVVSEERGQIGLALEGQLERDLTPDQLRERLRALIVQRKPVWRRSAAAYEL